MACTPHFDSDNLSGYWTGYYGELICKWTYDPATRLIAVKCGHEGKEVMLPTDQEVDRIRLSQMAIELTEKITGKKYDF